MMGIFKKNNNYNEEYNDYDYDYNYDDYDNNYYYNYDNNYGYNNYDNYDYNELYLSKRIFAKIIDMIILFISHYLIVLLYSYYYVPNLETKYILVGLLICLLLNMILEFLIIPSFIFRGQTIGKKIMKIRTITVQGFLIGFKENLISFIFIFLSPIDIIYLLKYKNFLHNKISNTIVKPLN